VTTETASWWVIRYRDPQVHAEDDWHTWVRYWETPEAEEQVRTDYQVIRDSRPWMAWQLARATCLTEYEVKEESGGKQGAGQAGPQAGGS
jgi:hypothetical protein